MGTALDNLKTRKVDVAIGLVADAWRCAPASRHAAPTEYARHAGGAWRGGRGRALESLARSGTVFLTVAAVRWAAEQMNGGGTFRAGERMCWYAELLTRVLAELDCC